MKKWPLIGLTWLVLLAMLSACGGAEKPIAVGQQAPKFSLLAADGSSVSLSDYRGQPVLLFFHMAEG